MPRYLNDNGAYFTTFVAQKGGEFDKFEEDLKLTGQRSNEFD